MDTDASGGSRAPAPLVLVDWVAARLAEPEGRVYELARLGLLPSVRLGRRVKFDPVAIEAWIDAGGATLPGGWRRESVT